ncbi:hypothetical protein [Nocardia sp. MW-W600-9]
MGAVVGQARPPHRRQETDDDGAVLRLRRGMKRDRRPTRRSVSGAAARRDHHPTGLRPGNTTPFDVNVALPPGTDSTLYAEVGATWRLAQSAPETETVDRVRGGLRDGPVER